LTIENEFVSVLNNSAEYPEIGGGGLAQNLTPFNIQISSNCPDGHIVQADLTVTSQEYFWDLHFTFILNAPEIVYTTLLVNDGDNNILDPGETSDVIVTLLNIGGADAFNGIFNINTDDEFLTINEGSFEINQLMAEESATAIFNVTASDSADIGHQSQINWNFNSDLDYVAEGIFNIVISLVPVYLFETFETFPPEGWSTSPTSNWIQGTWNQSGGDPPEAQFNWYPQSSGDQRLISPPVNTLGSLSLELEFKQSVSHFTGTYDLLVQTSSDGSNWNTAHSFPAGNISPTIEYLTISTPDVGAEEFRFAFCFSGDSYNINNWWIDDVILNSSENSSYGYLTGNVTLIEGSGSLHDVIIRAGNYNINPDNNGDYMLPLPAGAYNITAELPGYITAFENNVEIELLLTTTVNFQLQYLNPPADLQCEVDENDVYLNWDFNERPLLTGSEKTINEISISCDKETHYRNLTGFNVYRDDLMVYQILDSQILSYIDRELPNGEYTYYVTAQYDEGESIGSNESTVVIDFNDLTDDQIPLFDELTGNYPNPFNPETVISYQLSEQADVQLLIYNIKGQLVRELIDNQVDAGGYKVRWNGKDQYGLPVTSGVYFYKLQAGKFSSVKKMILIK
jgi:flagellar hook capping protein FlgD